MLSSKWPYVIPTCLVLLFVCFMNVGMTVVIASLSSGLLTKNAVLNVNVVYETHLHELMSFSILTETGRLLS